MYQNRRGITGLPCRREATNCTSHRPPNISAPVRPMIFHGDMCSPVHSSQAMGWFMKSNSMAPSSWLPGLAPSLSHKRRRAGGMAFHPSGLPCPPASKERDGSDLFDARDLGAPDQPGDAAQVGDADQRAIEVVVLGHARR